MKSPLWIVASFILTFISQISFCQNISNISGAVQVADLNGKTHKFSDLAKADEGIMIVSFWATWCKPCIQELNYLNDIYDELQEDYEVTVYAISIDDARTAKRVAPFVNGKSWEFNIFIDQNSDLKRKLSVKNIPHTFIIDKENNITYQHTSYVPGDEEIYLEIIEELNK